MSKHFFLLLLLPATTTTLLLPAQAADNSRLYRRSKGPRSR